jgi:hypothetical protein
MPHLELVAGVDDSRLSGNESLCPRMLFMLLECQAFVRLRESVSKHKDSAGKLKELENRYHRHFKVVFDAIRGLMKQPASKRRGIGFTAKFDDCNRTQSSLNHERPYFRDFEEPSVWVRSPSPAPLSFKTY